MPADEFEIIRDLFAPLAPGEGARGLADDAALMSAEGALVLTTDAIVEGVHFRGEDPIGDIARKALRVNLSDIYAKGAKPIGALLTLIWPNARPAAQIGVFAAALGEDLRAFDVPLLGGDTAATPGPLTVSMTLLGKLLGARMPARADAAPGEDVWVSGTIGDAWLGFEALTGNWPGGESKAREYAIARYRAPLPRAALAALVARHACAAMDVSDGLAGDARKLAAASGAALRIEAALIPLSEAARAWRADKAAAAYGRLFDWGDDYEILFTAPPGDRQAILSAAAAAGETLTRIGHVEAGEGAVIVDHAGAPLAGVGAGHAHKLGA